MHITNHSFQLPQYQSALLKKQRQSKVLSPKVNHVYPQISSIQKIKLKKHHLDDTQMKLALQYDYEENHLPKQYLFRGDRLGYDKAQYNSGGEGKRSDRKMSGNIENNSNGFGQTVPGNLNLNTEYFQTHQNFIPIAKPQRDINQYQTQTNQPPSRLKKSLSIPDLQAMHNNQNLLQQVIPKLNQIFTQTQRITKNIHNIQSSNNNREKYKSAHSKEDFLGRYRSEGKEQEGERRFGKLKERLERERTKEKRKLEGELTKLKEETKKIKEEERKRKNVYREIMERQQKLSPNSKYLENLMISASHGNNTAHHTTHRITDKHQVSQKTHRLQTDPLIDQKISQLQRKYLPKTNIVNKRIQCEIYDPRTDHVRRLQEKPRFRIGDEESDTDSQFSDF